MLDFNTGDPIDTHVDLSIDYIPPRGRPSNLTLNSMLSVSEEWRRCSLMAHANTDERSTP